MDLIITLLISLIFVFLIVYIIYAPYLVIMNFFDKSKHKYRKRLEEMGIYSSRTKPIFDSPRRAKNKYQILGSQPTDSFITIKKRYRELAKKYHPDLVKLENLSDMEIRYLKYKIQEINNAYDDIKKERGI